MPILLKLFPKIIEEETLLKSFYEAFINLIPQKKTTTHTKTKLQANITDENRHKNPQQNTSKLNPQRYTKGSYTKIKWELSQGCKVGVIPEMHIIKLQNKNQMIISIDAEKAFDKNKHPFMIEIL